MGIKLELSTSLNPHIRGSIAYTPNRELFEAIRINPPIRGSIGKDSYAKKFETLYVSIPL